MSKVITSPNKLFSGTVVLSDPLTYPQVFAFEDALDAVKALPDDASPRRSNYAILPGILACVEEWHIENMPTNPTLETFPASPNKSAAELLAWLVSEITALFDEANYVPLA